MISKINYLRTFAIALNILLILSCTDTTSDEMLEEPINVEVFTETYVLKGEDIELSFTEDAQGNVTILSQENYDRILQFTENNENYNVTFGVDETGKIYLFEGEKEQDAYFKKNYPKTYQARQASNKSSSYHLYNRNNFKVYYDSYRNKELNLQQSCYANRSDYWTFKKMEHFDNGKNRTAWISTSGSISNCYAWGYRSFNDKLSSFQVSPNVISATIYEDANYGGASITFTRSWSGVSNRITLPNSWQCGGTTNAYFFIDPSSGWMVINRLKSCRLNFVSFRSFDDRVSSLKLN